VRNWRGHPGLYPARAIGLKKIIPTQKKKYHCVACPLGCGSICGMQGAYSETHRPEYETAAGFGPNLLNRDLDSIYHLNETCNRMGLDSISASSAVGFAIECFQRGWITCEQTGGLELQWGDPATAIRLVEMITRREGIGDLLAEGVKVASERIGPHSAPYAMHAGGQELPYHDPRIDPAYGVLYISDPTPGRHTITSSTEYDMFAVWRKVSWAPEPPKQAAKKTLYGNTPESARMNAAGALYKTLLDCAGICLFGAQLGADRLGMFEMLNAALGWEETPESYMEIAHRIQTLRQMFNIRHGIRPAEVSLPALLYREPAARGPARGITYDLEAMRARYWQEMGWDAQSGIPTEAVLKKLECA
jgi:aldehyde:ferredoxin oxidoreductase